ncbi:MAG: hypothetical protein IKJ22_03745 [Paludibacteraceae bacterium]|nr:hypothetical protein [Paludibacteraceae bacterium]
MKSNIFFKPRYDKEKYEKGYKGYRTLILGVFHVCRTECKFREDCFKNTAKYDRECPVYKGREEYYSLSNSNEIEVESYLEECDSHYSYSYITKYFLRTNESVSENDKRKFWDSIAFTNFLQNMHGSYDTLKYKDNKKKFKDNLAAFKELLELLKPEVIYVISRAVKDCLCAKGNEINGLEFVDSYENWQVPIYRFTYKLQSKDTPKNILKEIESKLGESNLKLIGNPYKILLDKINAIKDLTFSVTGKNIDRVDEVLYSYALDKKFVGFLENYWHKKEIEVGLRMALKNVLELEKDITLDIDEVIRIINNNIPKYSATYMNDGVRIELFKLLDETLDANKMNEFNFIKALGIECASLHDWQRSRRNEYSRNRGNKISTKIIKYIKKLEKDNKFNGFKEENLEQLKIKDYIKKIILDYYMKEIKQELNKS